MEIISKKPRNVGIELLRIVSMFMIVVIHCNGHGGILEATKTFSLNNSIAYIGEAFVFVAVNVFAIICGYVNVNNKKRKLPRAIELWFYTAFYSVSLAVIFHFAAPQTIDTKTFIKSFIPITGVVYWYFSAYFCLMIFLPLINLFISMISKKQHLLFILIGFCVFGFYGVFSKEFSSFDIFSVSQGYSFLWLAYMYFIGAYIKKYEDDYKKIKNVYWLLIYVCCSILTWLSKVILDYGIFKVFGTEKLNTYYSSYFYIYTSPLYVISAVALLIYFKNLKITKLVKPITSVASVSFGVYLISEYPAFVNCFIKDKFINFASMPWYKMIVYVLGIALLVYIICTLIDYCRKYLFKLLHIRQLSNRISDFIFKLAKFVTTKLFKI